MKPDCVVGVMLSLHFVKTGRVPTELGKALNKAAEIRLIADYRGGEGASQAQNG